MPVARLRGIEKRYRVGSADVAALRGVDLERDEGELSALIGPASSGKTTLLNILGCLDLPTRGEYELGGKPIRARDFNDLAGIRSREIGFVFQGFNLVPVLTAFENVELPLYRSAAMRSAE